MRKIKNLFGIRIFPNDRFFLINMIGVGVKYFNSSEQNEVESYIRKNYSRMYAKHKDTLKVLEIAPDDIRLNDVIIIKGVSNETF